MANKYKNIVGTAFAPYVKDQLKQRAKLGIQNFTDKTPRSSTALQYFTNRNAWFRLSSSAETTDSTPPTKIVDPYGPQEEGSMSRSEIKTTNKEKLKNYNESFSGAVAKDNVLQGGTIISGDKNSTTLRKGFKNTYAEGAFDNLGLQPMPGITGITVGTGGKWQTLMQADIEFICYNLDQLDIMSKLYMSLGVTCFLEWGHLPYLDNSGNLIKNTTNIDFFGEKDKLNLIKSITKKRKETFGNYDAFLGTVYNFSYEADKDGAYLCKTQLMGAGGMVESLKINTSFNIDFANTIGSNKAEDFDSTLDNALFSMKQFLTSGKKIYETTKAQKDSLTGEYTGVNNFGKISPDIFFEDRSDKPAGYKLKSGETLNRSWGDLLTQIYTSATYNPFYFSPPNGGLLTTSTADDIQGQVNYTNDQAKFGNAHQYITNLDSNGLNPLSTDFYSGYAGMWTDKEGFFKWLKGGEKQEHAYITLGHLFALINSLGIFTESNSPLVDRKNSTPVLYIDYHPDNTIINLAPITATINPYKVIVPFSANDDYEDFFAPMKISTNKKYFFSSQPENVGLKEYNLSLSTTKNRINIEGVLPQSTFINQPINNDDVPGGKLMNALINIDFARDCLRSTKDSNNNTNLIEYVSKILEGINESLGGVNNLRPFIDECGLILRIIDEKAPEQKYIQNELIEIPTFGLGSVAYNASYQSAITPKLASQIVIATQAMGGQGIKDFSEDVLSYQSLNANVKDRFATYKYPAIVKPDNSEDLTEQKGKYLKSLLKLYEVLWGIYTPDQNENISASIVNSIKTPWIDLSNQRSKQISDTKTEKTKNTSPILIPLEYTITMDGLSGILPYNAFLIPNERLPKRYRGRVAFAVFSINHAFDNNNWTTTLRGQTLLLDTPLTLTKPSIIEANTNLSPKPKVDLNYGGYPKTEQSTFTVVDSPKGERETIVTNTTPSEVITQFGTITTGPDGLQSVSFGPSF